MSHIGDLLGNHSGDVNEHAPFLDDDELTEVASHVQRIFDEFVESSQRNTPEGEIAPTIGELSAQAMTVAFDIVFNVAYELGQNDAPETHQSPGITVTLDDAVTKVLVNHALRNILTQKEE